MDFMDQLKVNYVGHLMEDKPRSQVVRLLKEQEKMYPGQGLIAEVKEICERFELPDVTLQTVDPDWVKETIGWKGMYEVWKEVRESQKIPLHLDYSKKRKYYFDRPKMEAKMLFSYYVGELNLRTNRPREAEKKFGGVQCLVGVCCGVDSISHIAECPGYDTKAPLNMREEDLCKFLLEIHRERVRRWSSPLIMTDVGSLLAC